MRRQQKSNQLPKAAATAIATLQKQLVKEKDAGTRQDLSTAIVVLDRAGDIYETLMFFLRTHTRVKPPGARPMSRALESAKETLRRIGHARDGV